MNPLHCRLRFPVAIRQPGDKPKPRAALDYEACLLSIRNQSMQFVRHSPLTNRFARFHSFACADLHKFPQGARDLCPTLVKLCISPSSSSCVDLQVDLHNTGWLDILDVACAKIIQIFVKCVLGIRSSIDVAKISIIYKWISPGEGCSRKTLFFYHRQLILSSI